jgi:hypothetical protein
MSGTSGQSCDVTHFSPWVGFKLEISAEHIKEALEKPSAVKAALELGRLDYISALLAAIGVLIAIFGLLAYLNVRFSPKRVAEDEARKTTEKSVAEYFSGVGADRISRDAGIAAESRVTEFLSSQSGLEVVKQALLDPNFLAAFQAELANLGLTNPSDAVLVDSEPEFTDANGHNGSDR